MLEIEVALAAAAEPQVRSVVDRISTRRLAYVQQQFQLMGQTRARAKVRGLLAYSAYVGVFQTLRASPSPLPNLATKRAYVEHVIRTLLPDG